MKQTKLLLATMLLAITALTTSCLDADNSDSSSSASLYCTITGTNPNYTLYADGGSIICPTTSSVQSLTSSAGLGSYKRALFTFNYKDANVTTATSGITTVKDAELSYASIIPTNYVLTKEEADSKLITAADSTFNISDFTNAWAYNGYLTTIISGYYSADSSGSGIYPTQNLVYSPEDVSENAINLTLYYNRHCPQGTSPLGVQSFINSYSLEDLADVVPGSGDITITITPTDGDNAISCTVSREMLYFVKFQ